MENNPSRIDLFQLAMDLHGRSPEEIVRLPGGRNNVVARVRVAGEDCLLKVYFNHPDDRRDRLGAEFGMLEFLHANGIHCVPRPVVARPDLRAALYEFVEGTRLDSLDARIARLRANASPDARAFIASDLTAALASLKDFVAARAREWALPLDIALPKAERTLTPADHGFHNAIRGADGRLVFLDFEYAGWDDPAQMVANAWLQPELPMPEEDRVIFVHDVMGQLGAGARQWRRLCVVHALMAFKWALITLNEFSPVAGSRRAFAGELSGSWQDEQLAKSRAQLQAVREAVAGRSWLDNMMKREHVASTG